MRGKYKGKKTLVTPQKTDVLVDADVRAKVLQHEEILKGTSHEPGLIHEVRELREWKQKVVLVLTLLNIMAMGVFAAVSNGMISKLSRIEQLLEVPKRGQGH